MAYRRDDIFVALYVRLSDEDRDKQHEFDVSRSIQNQISMLTSYAEKNNWKIYETYCDDDYSGADRNRPDFNRLLKDAEEQKFQIVLCKSQSRFTRDMELVEHYLHEMFPRWGIRFVGLVDNADTDNKGNKKSRQINGLVNEWYLEDLSDNIKEVLTDRRKKGFHIGAFAPYGYMKDPEFHGHLIPDPEAALIVHRIFEMFASGMGKLTIARKLNEEGIPNPTEYKRIKGLRWRRTNNTVRSTLWQYFSIAEILINEVYIGNLVQGKVTSISYKTQIQKPVPKEKWIRVENTHAPIIERELWDKVQDIVNQRARAGWDGQVGIFARKTRCMYCGYTMRSKKGSDGLRCLTCSTAELNRTACRGGFTSIKYLEKIVLKELGTMIKQYLDMDEAAKQLVIEDDINNKIDTLKSELSQLNAKEANLDKTLKALYLDRVQGIISPEEYVKFSVSFKEDAEINKARILALNEQIANLEQNKTDIKSKKEVLEQVANITELTYDIVNTLIDYIEVGKRDGHYRKAEVPIIIHWKF
uniref:recombinase family protein n=1 Tax=Acetatifactor sp. TaxID=1872090 RepID=UPI004056FC2A